MAHSYRQLLAEAQQLLGKNKIAAAEELYRQVLAIRPRDTDAMHNLGIICNHTQRYDEAAEFFKQITVIKPYAVEAIGNLGVSLAAAGRHAEAIAAFEHLLTLKRDDARTQYNLGISLKSNDQLEAAAAAYRRAIELQPAYADAFFNLGNVLRALRKPAEAMDAFREALRIDPRHAEACNNLGHTLKEERRFEEAIEHFRRAMTLKPGFTDPVPALADALHAIGGGTEAVALYRVQLQTKPDDSLTHANLLFAMAQLPDLNPEEVFAEHVRWGERHAPPDESAPKNESLRSRDRSPERRLRIGYVSPDFREHSVAFFLENLLANHDAECVEVFCYSDVAVPDAVTARFRRNAHQWRDIAKVPHEDLVGLIRDDGIDILIDLAGHTSKHRLLVFAKKPAPVQVSYLGYTDTTGMVQIDYRLVDRFTDPEGLTDSIHTEKLIRLPRTFACYRPPENAPDVSESPALRDGYVTFACFGSVAKVGAAMLQAIAEILLHVPKSRFITCHALWMGVPAVSLAGRKYVSRLGASVLSNLGLPELVTHSSNAYVDIAINLAGDVDRLAELRAGLRVRMQASPLMEYPAFAGEVEAAYRHMWRQWCATMAAG